MQEINALSRKTMPELSDFELGKPLQVNLHKKRANVPLKVTFCSLKRSLCIALCDNNSVLEQLAQKSVCP